MVYFDRAIGHDVEEAYVKERGQYELHKIGTNVRKVSAQGDPEGLYS